MNGTALLVGIVVSVIMGLVRRLWPGLFKLDTDWAKLKRLLTSLLLTGAATVALYAGQDWEGCTLAAFVMAWATAWGASQGTHAAARLVPGQPNK